MNGRLSESVQLLGVLLVLAAGAVSSPIAVQETEVVLVNAIFRHGERTTYNFYPNDPNINETFFPIGLGGLTNKGKTSEYQLGKFLRREYDKLLGEYFYEGLIEARSTDTLRTKSSALLALAGLFPPSKEQIWNPDLLWQPIPVFSRPYYEEDVIHPDCARKNEIIESLPSRHDVQHLYVQPHQKLFNFVEEKSGMPIKNVNDLLEFYFIINTEDEMNLTIPHWVRAVYPEPIYSTASQTYNYMNHDEEARIINNGYLLQKMFNDINQKINNAVSHKNVKMFLYSGHESTVGFFLSALKVLKPHVPPYGAIILVELHRNAKQEYFIKLRYRMTPGPTKDLMIPQCAILCPLKQFIGLQSKILPTKPVVDACRPHN